MFRIRPGTVRSVLLYPVRVLPVAKTRNRPLGEKPHERTVLNWCSTAESFGPSITSASAGQSGRQHQARSGPWLWATEAVGVPVQKPSKGVVFDVVFKVGHRNPWGACI